MPSLPVALQLFSVREELDADFEGTLRRVKALGYQGVEFAGLYGRSAETVRTLLSAIGLEPVSAHIRLSICRDPIFGRGTAPRRAGMGRNR